MKKLTWKNVALSIGEQIAPIGIPNYYKLTPRQWYNWVLQIINKKSTSGANK